MALNAVINVKPKLARMIQEKTIATNAITLVSNFKDILTPEGIAYFLEQAMLGQAPRKTIKSFINIQGSTQQERDTAQLQAQNMAQMLQQNQMAYEQDPMSYETQNIMETQNPEEIDEIIAQLQSAQNGEQVQGSPLNRSAIESAGSNMSSLDMAQQAGAMAPGLEGMTPDAGSAMANPNSFGESAF